MQEKDLASGKLVAGALIHYRGLPFYIASDVKILGSAASLAETEARRQAAEEDPLHG